MQTTHELHIADARTVPAAALGRAHLVLTSPPYPMIAMWDAAFSAMSPAAAAALAAEDGAAAFAAMHAELDRVWARCAAALVPGGILAVNIGDATRSLAGEFRLYSNHARILAGAEALGLVPLPDIVWRKPTNAPNKFMGSGMLPGGAYVTYEHEYILLFRKGGRRRFRTAEARAHRARSAYFWEERNLWFSDLWTDLRGVRQGLDAATRKRSAAFPLALATRIVAMFSCQGETVLDPFAGTGTTAAAALALARNSVSIDVSEEMRPLWAGALDQGMRRARPAARARLRDHAAFVAARTAAGKPPKHHSAVYDMPVMTRQETRLELWAPTALEREGDRATATCAAVAGP